MLGTRKLCGSHHSVPTFVPQGLGTCMEEVFFISNPPPALQRVKGC